MGEVPDTLYIMLLSRRLELNLEHHYLHLEGEETEMERQSVMQQGPRLESVLVF